MSKRKYKIGIYKVSIGYLERLFSLYENELDLFELYFLHNLDFDNLECAPDIILIDDKLLEIKNIVEYAKKNTAQLIKLDNDVLKYIESNPSLCLDYVVDQSSVNKLEKFIKELNEGKFDKNREVVLLKYLFNVKDEYTRMHSENVSIYAVMLGIKLGLSESDLKKLRIGGLFHDIGKLGMPDYILKGTTSLNDDEYKLIKMHPVIGESIIGDYFDEDIKMIIKNHHERIDGNGYPDNLSGNDIPFLVKIISVVDCFDAMTSKRLYKESKNIEEVFDELKRVSVPCYKDGCITQQLDEYIVNVFIEMIRSNAYLMAYLNREFDYLDEEERKLVLK